MFTKTKGASKALKGAAALAASLMIGMSTPSVAMADTDGAFLPSANGVIGDFPDGKIFIKKYTDPAGSTTALNPGNGVEATVPTGAKPIEGVEYAVFEVQKCTGANTGCAEFKIKNNDSLQAASDFATVFKTNRVAADGQDFASGGKYFELKKLPNTIKTNETGTATLENAANKVYVFSEVTKANAKVKVDGAELYGYQLSMQAPFVVVLPMTNPSKVTIGSQEYEAGSAYLKYVTVQPKDSQLTVTKSYNSATAPGTGSDTSVSNIMKFTINSTLPVVDDGVFNRVELIDQFHPAYSWMSETDESGSNTVLLCDTTTKKDNECETVPTGKYEFSIVTSQKYPGVVDQTSQDDSTNLAAAYNKYVVMKFNTDGLNWLKTKIISNNGTEDNTSDDAPLPSKVIRWNLKAKVNQAAGVNLALPKSTGTANKVTDNLYNRVAAAMIPEDAPSPFAKPESGTDPLAEDAASLDKLFPVNNNSNEPIEPKAVTDFATLTADYNYLPVAMATPVVKAFKVVKRDAQDTSKQLAGAKFVIVRCKQDAQDVWQPYKSDGSEASAAADLSDAKITAAYSNSGVGSENIIQVGSEFTIPDAAAGDAATGAIKGELIINGLIDAESNGLTSSTTDEDTDPNLSYCIKETQAPAGYAPYPNLLKINFTTDGTNIPVVNLDDPQANAGFKLPFTGGKGIIPFIVMGILLVAAAGFWFLAGKRRKDEEENYA